MNTLMMISGISAFRAADVTVCKDIYAQLNITCEHDLCLIDL